MAQELFDRMCSELAGEKKAFLKTLEDEFAPIIKSSKEKNNFEWMHLKRFYNKEKHELTNLYSLRIYCEFAFKLFFTFNCQDDEFVIKIIHIYQHVMAQYKNFDLCAYCKRHDDFPIHYHGEDLISSRSILKSVNKLEVDTYKFSNGNFYSRLAVGGIYVGDYTFVQLLVKYGLSYFPDDIFLQARLLTESLWTLFSNYVLVKPEAGNDTETEREQFADSVLKKLYENVQLINLRKINLIVLAIDIYLCKLAGDFCSANYAKCLDLYASTLPVPISMKDVKCILHLIFSNDKVFIDEIFSRFKDIFPDIPDFPSPRPLKYLCRCKVRDYIQKCPSLTTVVTKMQLPVTIKNYLLYMSD